TTLTFTTEAFDSDGFLSPTSGVVTIPSGLGGWYAWQLDYGYSAALGNNHFLLVSVNSGDANYKTFDANTTGCAASGVILLDAGDTFQFKVFHTAGASRSVSASSLNIVRLAI